MKRNVDELENQVFDLVVVGGGALGAWTAREAALQEWDTALIEATDFGAGASWNNLKIVHGGLRYLQRLDLRRMRESIRERSHLLRAAPHLVHPLPIIVPSFSSGLQRRSLLQIASRLNDFVSWDRNRNVPVGRRLPSTRVLSRAECLDMLPFQPAQDITGGIIFHDGQMYAPERLVLEIVKDAVGRGVTALNRIECRGLRKGSDSVHRVIAVDRQTDTEIEIRTSAIVNATGASALNLAEKLTGEEVAEDLEYSVALNVLLESIGNHEVAFTLPAAQSNPGSRVDVGKRQLLFVPWRDHTLVGTGHYHWRSDVPPTHFDVDEHLVERFLEEVGTAVPGRSPSVEDVALVHGGLLPVLKNTNPGVNLLGRGRVIDHGDAGYHGVFTAVSVKFTTCRALAERVLQKASDSLHRSFRSGGEILPLQSAPTSGVAVEMDGFHRACGDLVDSEIGEHLIRMYGSEWERVLSLAASVPGGLDRLRPDAPVIFGQLLYALRNEMANTLDDVLYRRTELGPRGLVTGDLERRASDFLHRNRSGLTCSESVERRKRP